MDQQKKTVLIVEDDQSLARALSIRLATEGYNMLNATNGKQGLEMALESKPDLILLDLMMPIMDGVTALKKLREDEWGKKVDVLVLTNEPASSSKFADVIENNVTGYLIKADWSLDMIADKVKERLAAKH